MLKNEDSINGFAFAMAAYILWGFLPLYMKAIAHIPPAEVIAHRVIWSVPIAGAVLWATGRTADLRAALRTPRIMGMAAVTAALISLNWGIYVWAIASGRALDAALGYYINPLFSVLLGAVLLGERPNRAQSFAIVLAGAAVAVLTWEGGGVPVVALGLTVTFGLYAYLKKSLPVGANQGFLLEVLLLTPPALLYWAYLSQTGQGHFMARNVADLWLLLGCGFVTAVPLMLYANGAKLLRLSTIGILQYIVPTMIFLTAVFVFEEPLGKAQLIAFPMIWTALIIYTWAMIRRSRQAKADAAAAGPPL